MNVRARKRGRRGALLLAFVLGLSTAAVAAETVAIEGQLADASGAPVSGEDGVGVLECHRVGQRKPSQRQTVQVERGEAEETA